MAKLSQEELAPQLAKLQGWAQHAAQLERIWTFLDFNEAMDFVNKVAELANAADHHPDIDIRYNQVKLVLSTHSEGGITAKDIELARQISSLP